MRLGRNLNPGLTATGWQTSDIYSCYVHLTAHSHVADAGEALRWFLPLARTLLVKFPTAAVSTTIPVNEGNQPPGKTASQVAANVCFAEEPNVKR